jgi:ABC-type transport system involved in cytochrome c biogenesis permease subunit
MLKFSQYSLFASLMLVVLAMICYVLVLTLGRSVRRVPVTAHAGGQANGHGTTTDVMDRPTVTAKPRALALYGTYFTQLALAFLTACLVFLTLATGHGPFTNQYEFSLAFSWGMLTAYAYFEHRYHVRTIGLLILPITGALLLYALTLGSETHPLVPALQNPLLLTIHVAVATVAYGAFAVSFATAVLYLFQRGEDRPGLPKRALLDQIGYRAVIIGFPLDTMTVVLGAVWAQKAWGTYWSWDPKETASLVTWLIYGAYLHARVARGWTGNRAAWLLVAGFASVIFCFFGNLFFGGLHSYGAPTR